MENIKHTLIKKSVLAGVVAILFLALFYFTVLTWVTGDWQHPFQQFVAVKYWMSGLFIGFGVQIGLFWYSRLAIQMQNAKRIAAANTTVSTATMVACCAHHIADVIPVLGVSALTIFLAKYQIYFMVFGILLNGAGIAYMYSMIKKHQLHLIHDVKI